MYPKFHSWICYAFLLFSISLQAQEKPLDNSYYFDDDQISTSKSIIKTDLGWIIQKELPILWEYSFAERMSFELGAGFLLPGYTHSYFHFIDTYTDGKISDPGFSLSIQGKIYTGPNNVRRKFFTLGIKQHHFTNLTTTDFFTGIGTQYHVGDRVKIDLGLNIGMRHQNSFDNATYLFDPDSRITVAIPLHFRIGYML